ncbi:MAG: family 10 glycosylhydrolase, partial [Planctomycetota bacterium]
MSRCSFRFLFAALLMGTAASCSARGEAQRPGSPGQRPGPPDVEARRPADRSQTAAEFRGVWVATGDNIDFPSRPGLPSTILRQELDAIVARSVQLGLNALVFQVRPAADALYDSPLEPWSEWLTGTQGKAPDGNFDPLAYVIERSHRA